MASDGISTAIGPGTLCGTSGYTLVYRALVTYGVECAECERLLEAGEEFTRAKIRGGGPANYPHCAECRPFEVDRALAAGQPEAPESRSGERGEETR